MIYVRRSSHRCPSVTLPRVLCHLLSIKLLIRYVQFSKREHFHPCIKASAMLQDLPHEVLDSIFYFLKPTTDADDVLNAMNTCRHLYYAGLPTLYRDVVLRKPLRAPSFFKSIERHGYLVRRLGIEERCLDPRWNQTYQLQAHTHIFEGGLIHVGDFCSQLRSFYVFGLSKYLCVGESALSIHIFAAGDIYDPDTYLGAAILRIVKRCPLESLILPKQTHDSVLRFQSNLPHLTRFMLDETEITDDTLISISNHCLFLVDVRLMYLDKITLNGLRKFAKAIPGLEILTLNTITALFVPVATHILLESLASSNRNIHTFGLVNCQLGEYLPDLPPDAIPNLKVLDITDSAMPHNLVPIVNSLPALERLYVSGYVLWRLFNNVCPPRPEIIIPLKFGPDSSYFKNPGPGSSNNPVIADWFLKAVEAGKIVIEIDRPDVDTRFPWQRSIFLETDPRRWL